MQFYHTWRWAGLVQVTVYDEADPAQRVLKDFFEVHNQICDVGRNLMADALGGAVTSATINYIALGSDNGTSLALSGSNTQLGSEQFRKAVTSTARPATGQRQTTGYIAPSEACASGGLGTNFTIAEVGFFAGVTATATVNSGVLVARVFYSRAKSASESLQIVRTDQF